MQHHQLYVSCLLLWDWFVIYESKKRCKLKGLKYETELELLNWLLPSHKKKLDLFDRFYIIKVLLHYWTFLWERRDLVTVVLDLVDSHGKINMGGALKRKTCSWRNRSSTAGFHQRLKHNRKKLLNIKLRIQMKCRASASATHSVLMKWTKMQNECFSQLRRFQPFSLMWGSIQKW